MQFLFFFYSQCKPFTCKIYFDFSLYNIKTIKFGYRNIYHYRNHFLHFNVGIHTQGEVLPVMDYMGMLCPKWVPFSGWRYVKGVPLQERVSERVPDLEI